MADSFRASFVLHLQDDITAGMQRIIAMTKRFADLAKTLGFRNLDGADATVRTLGKDVGILNTQLGTTVRQAEAAAGAIKRMSAADLARARAQVADAQRMASLQRSAATGGPLDQIYGRAGVPLIRPGMTPFEPAEAGASSRMGWRGRVGNAVSGAGQRLSAASGQVGLMGGALAGIGLEASIHQAAELDHVLRQITITQHMSGQTAENEINRLRHTLTADAIETGQPLQELAKAYYFLLTTGMKASTVDQLMPIHSRTATAYGVSPDAMGQAVFALHDSFGINHDDMSGALAAMAQATQEGHFGFEAMSRYLPTIGGITSQLGMKGRVSADKVFAALESVVKNAADPSQAAVDFTDMLKAMTQPYAKKAFAKQGIDIQKVFSNATKAGQDPMEAYINELDRMTKDLSDPIAKAFRLGAVLHNMQAGTAALALLQHRDDYTRMRDELHGIGAEKLQKDFDAAMAGLMPQLLVRAQKVTALEQRMGLGFAWTVPVSSALLGGIVVGLNWMDDHLPGVTNVVLGLTGGMLGLVAVMGVLGVATGPVKAGFLLMGNAIRGVFSLSTLRFLVSPWLALPLLLGAAVMDIWQHWERFRQNFHWMWDGLKQAANGFVEFLNGAFSGDLDQAARGLANMSQGIGKAWRSWWEPGGIMERLMTDFVNWLPSWGQDFAVALGKAMQESYAGWHKFITDMKADLASITPAAPHLFMVPPADMTPENWEKYKPMKPIDPVPFQREDHGGPGMRKPASYILRAPGEGGTPAQRFDGTIRIELDGAPAKVTTTSSDPRLRLLAPNRGPMLVRT
jgi:TP901 family phage tail tape measure protein